LKLQVIKKRNLKRMRDIKERRLELLNNAADAKVLPSHLNEISESVYQSFEVFFKGSDKRSPLLSVGQGRELTQAIAKFPPMVVWSAPSGGGTGAPRTIAVVSRNRRFEDRHGGKATLMWMVVDVKGDCNSTHCTYDPAGDRAQSSTLSPAALPLEVLFLEDSLDLSSGFSSRRLLADCFSPLYHTRDDVFPFCLCFVSHSALSIYAFAPAHVPVSARLPLFGMCLY
jgi:hypothetical protein